MYLTLIEPQQEYDFFPQQTTIIAKLIAKNPWSYLVSVADLSQKSGRSQPFWVDRGLTRQVCWDNRTVEVEANLSGYHDSIDAAIVNVDSKRQNLLVPLDYLGW